MEPGSTPLVGAEACAKGCLGWEGESELCMCGAYGAAWHTEAGAPVTVADERDNDQIIRQSLADLGLSADMLDQICRCLVPVLDRAIQEAYAQGSYE